MRCLPLANVLHHKLRSVLLAVGIGIGVCMLITLSGLARGTLYEVADRWDSVDADLIVFPSGWKKNAAIMSGSGLSDSCADIIRRENARMVSRVVPVFTWHVKFGKQDQMVAGVDSSQWHTLTGGGGLAEGRIFDPQNKFARWIERECMSGGSDFFTSKEFDPSEADLRDPAHNGLEIVIDERLAASESWQVGTSVFAANHHWKIVGIVPAGAMTRVFMSRRIAQFLFGSGNIRRSTLMFVKLNDGVDVGRASRAIARATDQDVVPKAAYRSMLADKFGKMFVYVDAVNAVAMVIAFLFTMVTLYTAVLQRRREIAILKSCGASGFYIWRQVMGEAMLLTAGGVAVGVAMSFAGGWAIEALLPLMTVTITLPWIAIAIAAAGAGAAISSIYPAWRAVKVDMVEALSFE